MVTGTKLKVAIFSRVSTEEQANEGVSIEAQRADLKAYATGMNRDIFDEYVDGGYSGGTDDRPAFKRLIRDAREKRFDIVAVCKLGRFFRNLRLLLNYLYELEELGIKFVSVQEGLDTSTPYGKFAVQIMGVIAEFERGRIGERVKDARRHIISRGDWPGGTSLYGYRWCNRERKWDIDPSEAEVVRKVYDHYLNDNLGMVPIADRLNEEGILTRRGARCPSLRSGRHLLVFGMPQTCRGGEKKCAPAADAARVAGWGPASKVPANKQFGSSGKCRAAETFRRRIWKRVNENRPSPTDILRFAQEDIYWYLDSGLKSLHFRYKIFPCYMRA